MDELSPPPHPCPVSLQNLDSTLPRHTEGSDQAPRLNQRDSQWGSGTPCMYPDGMGQTWANAWTLALGGAGHHV